jgi:acyl dehydratase
VPLGGRSTLTFTIDNTANASDATSLIFSDTLPTGMAVASPSNATMTCLPLPPLSSFPVVFTAVEGGNVVSLGAGGYQSVAAGATCTVSVDVIVTSAGRLENVSGALTSTNGFTVLSSGAASAVLDVTATTLSLSKSFPDDPATPGGSVTLEFTLTNRDRSDSASAIAFADDLDAALTGLVAASVDANTCGGTVDITTPGMIDFSGGSLASGASCAISLTLTVPVGAAPGSYPNTTSAVTGTIGGSPVTGNTATENLYVAHTPQLTKTFLTNPVGAGDTVALEFTISNTNTGAGLSNIAFSDDISAFISGTTVTSGTGSDVCGTGSTLSLTGFESTTLVLSGGSLAASGSCTFQVDLQLPLDTPAGTHTNTTTAVTADGVLSGNPATDTLTVLGAPTLQKSFTDDPVAPGGTVTLEFTLSHDANAAADATSINFTDDLSATLSGLAATGLPMNDVCGAGSQISGSTSLSFTGGTLAPGASCTFSVTLDVPAGALPGSYSNTTSNLVATVSGQMVTGNPGVDTLDITGLTFTKEFIDDPVLPGDTATLRFTLDNTSPSANATTMLFTDSLSATLTSLAAVPPLPTTPCGAGSTLSGTTTLTFSGGNLTAGTSCSFDVTVQVPGGAANGTYTNVTSPLSALIDSNPVVLNAASDTLTVSSSQLLFGKSFTDDPVAPGDTVTLEFTVTNLDASNSATALAFTDDLTTVLTGLTAIGLPVNDVCGAGSQISGTTTLGFTGGTLAPAASCTFSVTLQVPAGAAAGTTATNTTSQLTGMINGLGVTGDPATDDLHINSVVLTKNFTSSPAPGETVSLSFTLQNYDGSAGVADMGFSDDLDAVVAGLVATGLPANDVCGSGSQLSGTSTLTLIGANLLPGGSCTFAATLQVPASATPGTYTNTTSDVTVSGLPVATPATASLTIVPPPLPSFDKAFAPATIYQFATSTLTFTIDNSASPVMTTGLSFSDTMPTGMTVAGPASTTCTGGTLTATPGTDVIAYSGGSVPAGSSCTIQVGVTSDTTGSLVNTSGALTSTYGSSGTASDTLVVNSVPAPVFDKVFTPNSIVQSGVSTLVFTINNDTGTVAASSLSFTDNLPAGLVIASPANASTSCSGGTLTASTGTGVVSYSGGSAPARTTCTIQVDVTSAVTGSYVNTTSALTSSLGNSGVATDTLTVTSTAGADDDNDGVPNGSDVCPGTTIPESVPTISQYAGRYALGDDDDTIFDTITDVWRPDPGPTFTLDDTAGCSCEQIIAIQNLPLINTQYGCDLNVMQDWVDLQNQ